MSKYDKENQHFYDMAFPGETTVLSEALLGQPIRAHAHGLSKREYFAALLMPIFASLSNGMRPLTAKEAASEAVEYADALLAELAKPTKGPSR